MGDRGKPQALIAALCVSGFFVSTVVSAAEADSDWVQGATADSPGHWADRNGNLPAEPLTAVAVDPADAQVIYAGLDGFLFRSDDAGESWLPVLSFPRGLADDGTLNDTSVDAFDGAQNGQSLDLGGLPAGSADLDGISAGGRDDGVDDDVQEALDEQDDFNGRDFEDPVDRGQRDDVDIDDDIGTLGGGAGGPSADPLDTVDLSAPPRSGPGVRAVGFVPGSSNIFYVATPRGLYRTTTSAGTFDRLNIPGGIRENDIRDVVVDPIRPSRVWVGTDGGLFLSEDGGASFVRDSSRLGSVPIVDIDVQDAGARIATHVLVGTERGVMRSRDGGETFNDLILRGEDPFPVVHSVAWSRADDSLYVGNANGLFVGERGGAILENFPGVGQVPVASLLPHRSRAGRIVMATRDEGDGVVFSADAGLTVSVPDSFPAQGPVALAQSSTAPFQLWVASAGGLFRLEAGSGIRVSRDGLESLRARLAREPDITTVMDRALRYHGYHHDDDDRISRAGYAALLPRVQAAYRFDAGDTDQVRNSFIFRDPTTLPPVIDPDQDNQDLFGDGLLIISPTQQLRHTFWVTLTWDLDRLVLNPQALAGQRQLPLIRNAERQVTDRAQQLYVSRRRLVAELAMARATGDLDQTTARIRKHLKLQELEAHLAALVGEDLFPDVDDDLNTTGPETRTRRRDE